MFCGLAILLSAIGHPSPLAASMTSMLPFDRLEAGIVQGESGAFSFQFVLFRVPNQKHSDFYLGNFFCSSMCHLHKPQRNFVMLKLDEQCAALQQELQTQQPSESNNTASSTTTSWSQFGQIEYSQGQRQTQKTSGSNNTASSATTSGRVVYRKQACGKEVVSSTMPWVLPSTTSIQDGCLQATGPYGIRVLSFLLAWDFRKGHDRGRAVEAVKEARPAFTTGFVTGSSWDTFVSVAKLQEEAGRLYALVCVPKAVSGLQTQLKDTTAVEMSLMDKGPRLYVVVNDKTLARICSSVSWKGSSWATSDPEDLDLCVRTFLQSLCYAGTLDNMPHPSTCDVAQAANKHRSAFDGLLSAVRTQTAFLAGSTVAFPSFGEDEVMELEVEPTVAPEDEQNDEVFREVQHALQPSGKQAVEAMKKVDDFRKHESSGRFSLHPHLRREIFKVHRNLNHPAKEVFIRAMKHSGARADVIQWIKDFFVCPLCESAKRPLPRRPAHLAKALDFNAIVAVDLFYLNAFGAEKIFLICVDHGTGYLQVTQCADARAITVRQALSRAWIAPFGVPEVLICDQGPEFVGEQFVEFMSQMGTAIHYTDGSTPWKNGRAERAVGTVKNKLKVVLQETSATEEELDLVVAQVVSAHNSLYDRHGFSPDQRLFGRSLRLPGSLLADDRWDQEMVKASAGDLVQRSWAIREAARAAWIKEDDVVSVRRASAAQTRKSDIHAFSFYPGQWAYVWRRNDNRHGWVGPGALIAVTPGGNSWWINMRGRLWKVATEQLRPASSEEELGAALALELHKDLLHQVREGVRTGYEDVTVEGPPDRTVEEIFPEVFGEDATEDREEDQERLREQPRAFDEATTTLGDGHSERALTSEPSQSRRQSVMSSEHPRATATASGQDLLPLPAPSTTSPRDGPRPSDVELDLRPPTEPLSTEAGDTPRRAIRVDEGPHEPLLLGPSRERPGPYTRSPHYYSKATDFGEKIKPSTYLAVTDFDNDALNGSMSFMASTGPRWVARNTSGRTQLEPLKPKETFQAEDSEASYCLRDRCMYLAKAKVSFGQVEYSKLAGKEREAFRQARAKEFESLLSNNAVKVLTVEESERFMRDHPDHVLKSRFVDRYKPQEIGLEELQAAKEAAVKDGKLEPLELTADTTKPKSRWCVVGWSDPHVHQIERSAPTPSSAAVNTVLQVNASRRWSTFVRDVKTAFLQSRPTSRQTPLACQQPVDETLPGLDPKQLLLLLTEVYGLVSGPAWWRSSLLKHTGKLGYKVCPYEPCVLVLPADRPSEPTRGLMVIEVDDVIEGGDEKHRSLVKQLEGIITFGKIINLQEQETTYAGKSIRQMPDFSFTLHMEEYIYTRLAPINLKRKVLKKDAAKVKLDDFEKSQLRGLLATLIWVGREGRPDAAAASSILASSFPEPTMEVIYQANDVVRQLKQNPILLKIHAIQESRVRNVLISDSAFDTSGKEKSQHGYLLGFTSDLLNTGKKAPISLMKWQSRRLRRKAQSSMLCEAISLSAATGSLEKQDALWDAMRLSNYQPRQRQVCEETALELQGKTTVISQDSGLFRDPRSVVVIDAKSLYDSLLNNQPGECERSNLEAEVIRESLTICRARVRWVPHNFNPSDALTKFPGAHLEPLVRLLKTGSFQITDEQTTLEQGRQGLNRLKTKTWEQASGNLNLQGAVNRKT